MHECWKDTMTYHTQTGASNIQMWVYSKEHHISLYELKSKFPTLWDFVSIS